MQKGRDIHSLYLDMCWKPEYARMSVLFCHLVEGWETVLSADSENGISFFGGVQWKFNTALSHMNRQEGVKLPL